MKQKSAEALTHLRNRIYIIIEGTDTRLGKFFDIVLLIAILTSVGVVMLDIATEGVHVVQSRPATSTCHSFRTKSGRRYCTNSLTESLRATRKQIESQCSRMRVVVRAARTWTQLQGAT